MNSAPNRFNQSKNDLDYSEEELAKIFEEAEKVFSDTTIKVYHLPDHSELIEIISFALGYNDNWYWARVTLPASLNCENSTLIRQVIKLGASYGIYICKHHMMVDEVKKHLKGYN